MIVSAGLFASIDESVADARGVPTRGLGIAFLLVLGLAVGATAQITGVLLVFALLVAPAATAQQITPRIGVGLMLTIAIGVLKAATACHAGMIAAFLFILNFVGLGKAPASDAAPDSAVITQVDEDLHDTDLTNIDIGSDPTLQLNYNVDRIEDVSVPVEHALFSLEGGQAATTRLLRHGVTGVICASDVLALGAIRAVRRAGLSVPADVSVVGFDDSAFMNCTDPPLTTVRQPIESMGKAAVALLVNQMENVLVYPEELLFEPELVVRGSTGPLRTAGAGAAAGRSAGAIRA